MQYNDEHRNFTLTATGDLFITRKLSPYTEPEYLQLWDIVRSANIRFTNLEMLIHEFAGHPVAESGGTYTQVDPWLMKELVWSQFNLFSRANNHSLDYSIEAMRRTSELLDKYDFCHAGVGENLSDARSPRYLDLNEGRVALLSASSSFASFGRAGDQRHDMMGRPGLNPIRYTTYFVVNEENLEKLRGVSTDCGIEAMKKMAVSSGYMKQEKEDELNFAGVRFLVGEKPGMYTKINESDRLGNLKWIEDARQQSDFVLYSLHCHEGDVDRWKPAIFHQPFARDCIDAGADAFVGHGAHFMRGIEIYKNKPIFYSLGNFVFQNETVRKLPADVYEKVGLGSENTPAEYYNKRSQGDQRGFPADAKFWETVLPWCRFENGQLIEMHLYPVTLGYGKRRTVRGRPMLATGQLGERIIETITKLSAPYGTKIQYKDGKGTVIL